MASRTPWLLLAVVVAVSSCQCQKPPPAKPTLLHEGEACSTDDACDTGLCDGLPGAQAVCVRRCSVGCTATEVCTQLTPNRFACQPDQRKVCQPCQADSDCPYPSDKCLVVNGEHVCGRDCAFDQNCPTGYHCVNGLGTDGQPKLEQCTPINASCSCLARGDFLQPCTVSNDAGTCHGIKQCDLVSNQVVCDAKAPEPESCNGADDDCDGFIDDGLPTVSCGVGACTRNVTTCSDGGVAACVPGTPVTETCNGVDDDCDGTVDNGFNTTSDVNNCGACSKVCSLPHATPRCDQSTCKIASCDAHYGDCNSTDSDGCETDLRVDPMNCGSCGNQCVQAHATATCVSSQCQFACAAGWVDLDQNPANGCEYQCTPTGPTDLPDLGVVDANCDGIDGEVSQGIFVSLNGDDANPGTMAQPVKTLAAAVTKLVTTGKRDLYVAATGTTASYPGPLELLGMSGVNVAGGYDATTWKRSLATTTLVQGGNPALKIEGTSNALVQSFRFEGGAGTAGNVTAYGGWVKEVQGVKLESLNVVAGNGADGVAGAVGATGTAGGAGAQAGNGCVGDQNGNLACFVWYNSCTSVPAGAGGTSACGFPGGPGGTPTYSTTGGTGGFGFAAPNGTGGRGSGVPAGSGQGPFGAPYVGGNGAAGSAGTNGAGANVLGTLGANGFVTSNGTGGTAGTPGKGAGGGGGGAGSNVIDPLGVFPTCNTWGSAGGGGGGGACGGEAGGAGSGGGASIGLFLFNAQVSAQGVVVKAGNGGPGGAGGQGGQGGTGGAPGPSPYDSDQGTATAGGAGGKGGDGGRGGHGGAGAGGNVYGLAKNSGSTWNAISGTSFMIGTAGAGGTGAASGLNGVNGTTSITTTF